MKRVIVIPEWDEKTFRIGHVLSGWEHSPNILIRNADRVESNRNGGGHIVGVRAEDDRMRLLKRHTRRCEGGNLHQPISDWERLTFDGYDTVNGRGTLRRAEYLHFVVTDGSLMAWALNPEYCNEGRAD